MIYARRSTAWDRLYTPPHNTTQVSGSVTARSLGLSQTERGRDDTHHRNRSHTPDAFGADFVDSIAVHIFVDAMVPTKHS